MIKMLPLHVGWFIVASFIIGIIGNTIYLLINPSVVRKPEGLLISFMMLNIFYVTVVGNFMDIGENNRFRYVVDAFILLLAIRAVYGFFYGQNGRIPIKKEIDI
jgi:hypothetical protein